MLHPGRQRNRDNWCQQDKVHGLAQIFKHVGNPKAFWRPQISPNVNLSPRILIVEYHLLILSYPHSNTLGIIIVLLVEFLRTDATNVPDILHAQETIPRRCERALIASIEYWNL